METPIAAGSDSAHFLVNIRAAPSREYRGGEEAFR